MSSDKAETTPDAEYRKSAEGLITAACYMADPSTGRKSREHWQREFKKKLIEHEKKFSMEKSDAA